MSDAIATSPKRNWLTRTIIAIIGVFVAFVVIAVGGYYWFDSQSGKRFVVGQIEALTFENGVKIRIGSLGGSLYNKVTLNDVALVDTKGIFASAKVATMDWHPFAFANNHIDIDAVAIPTARLHRMPALKAVPISDDPFFPDYDINIDKLVLSALMIDPVVTGKAHVVRVRGRANIADRRAIVVGKARALARDAIAGGDIVDLTLIAVPDDNQFDLALKIDAPATGLVASYTSQPLRFTATIAGKGTWQNWQGTMAAQSGGTSMAILNLAAQNGTFTMRGVGSVKAFAPAGTAKNLLAEPVQMNLTAVLENRRADLTGDVRNANFSVDAKGLVDFAQNQFEALTLNVSLPHPERFARNVSGRNLRANVILNGGFAKPVAAYRINADALAFNDTIMQGVALSGVARVDPDRIFIPVTGRIKAVWGLAAAAGELLTNIVLGGDLAYANGRILSDNIKIKSDRVDATMIILADVNRGLYTSAINGRVNNYHIASVGTFNLETNVDLKAGARAGFVLAGTVRARSLKWQYDSVKTFLGGNDSVMTADVRYGDDGVATITNLRVAAPAFRLAGGSGRYAANGGIILNGAGYSDRYGPLGVAVSGTLTSPVARITAKRPGFGIGIANVVAEVRARGNSYAINARGDSDYGAFSGDFAAVTGRGPLTITIPRADFAGVGLSGRLQQSRSGPFTGNLVANGAGIEGDVKLSAVGKIQRVFVNGTARDARLQSANPLSIGRAIVSVDVTFYENPHIIADVQVAEMNRGSLAIVAARSKVIYRGGSGSAKIIAEGRSGVPFRIAANAELTPNLWRIAAQGRANGIDFKTQNPAQILPAKAGYTLKPTVLLLSSGSVQLAGSYGRSLRLQSRLTSVDLAILNSLYPGLGVSGTATGSVDFAQASSEAFPLADARLSIAGFSRTSAALVSVPIDLNLIGRLSSGGANVRAVIRRQNAIVGRMQANLAPLPSGAGSWNGRIMAAPLSGGIRYNGPANALFSLVGLPDQFVRGALGIAADFSGRLQAPLLSGVVRANALTYENNQFGTKLTDMRLRGTFTNDRLDVSELTATAGKGRVSGKGFVSLSSTKGFPLQLDLIADNARLANSSDIAASATGTISIANNGTAAPTVTGTLRLPETRYKIVRQGGAKVATLTGVRRKPAIGRQKFSADPDALGSLPKDWNLDIKLIADNQVYVSGMGLESEWMANLVVKGTSNAPRISGQVTLIRGTLGFAGRSFALSQGRINFDGASTADPSVILAANADIDGVTTNINISGRAYEPKIVLSSTPSLPQDEVLARMLFGNSIAELSPLQAVQLASSLNSLRSGGGGLNPLGVLQSATGLSRLRILGPDSANGRGTAIAAGQYITNDVYVEIVTDARGYTASQIEITLARGLSVLSQVGSFGGSNVNVRYKMDY